MNQRQRSSSDESNNNNNKRLGKFSALPWTRKVTDEILRNFERKFFCVDECANNARQLSIIS